MGQCDWSGMRIIVFRMRLNTFQGMEQEQQIKTYHAPSNFTDFAAKQRDEMSTISELLDRPQ